MLLVFVIALVVDRAGPAAPVGACDLDLVRDRAQQSVPDYRLEGVDSQRGVVTLLFKARDGAGAFAVALHASGTALSTSVGAVRIDDAEVARVSSPFTTWWQRADLQQSLASCCVVTPGTAVRDLKEALNQALSGIAVDDTRSAQVGPLRAALLLGSAWIVLFVFAARAVLRVALARGQQLPLLRLFLFSLLVNWLLSTGGPGDLRLNLAPIWANSELELRWGPSPIALFRVLAFALGGLHDTHIVWINLVLSSLLPILMYAIVVELEIASAAALLAGYFTAAHPLLIAFAGDLGRQPTYLLAALGSTLVLAGFLRRGDATSFVAFVLGATLAVTSRPEGAHVLIVHLAILLLMPASSQRRRLVGLFALAILTLLAYGYARYVLEYGTALTNRDARGFGSLTALLWTVLFDRDFTPMAWTIMWMMGLAVGVRRRPAWMAIACVLGLHVAWTVTGVYDMFVGFERQVASARYESILLLPFGIGTALFCEAVLSAGGWVKVVAAVVVIVSTLLTVSRPYDTLLRPFTVDYEYQFLKRLALTLPARSQLYIFQSPVNDIGFIDAAFVASFVPSAVKFAVWTPSLCTERMEGARDAYLYIGSSCADLVDHPKRPLGLTHARWLSECALARGQVASRKVEEIEVPAHKMSWYEFKESTIPLGVYRLYCPPVAYGTHAAR